MQYDIDKLFNDFSQQRVLVIGDIMLDEYIEGDVTRISPEAPVPVVSVTNRKKRLGGAANVAFNLKQLGADAILCSIRGNDSQGEWMHNYLDSIGLSNKGIFIDMDRPTTRKTRIIGNNHQVLRVDQEDITEINPILEQQLLDFIKSVINDVDVVIFQDYNKGLLTQKLITQAIKLAKQAGKPSLVDPKRDHFLDFKGVDLFKPNRKEIIDGLKLNSDLKSKEEIEAAVRSLSDKLNTNQILLTLSEMGVAIYHNNNIEYIDAHPRKILDVSGAGDSVISVASLGVALGLDWPFIAEISNLAGGLVCEKVGVVPINKELLMSEIKRITA